MQGLRVPADVLRLKDPERERLTVKDPQPEKTIPFGKVADAEPMVLLLPLWIALPMPRIGPWSRWKNPGTTTDGR